MQYQIYGAMQGLYFNRVVLLTLVNMYMVHAREELIRYFQVFFLDQIIVRHDLMMEIGTSG